MKTAIILTFSLICCVATTNAENGKPVKNNLLPVPPQANACDSVIKAKPQFSISNSFTNSYYWRGLTFNEGLMLQPSAAVTYKKWFASTWSNIVAMETGQHVIIPEVDFTAGYQFTKNNFSAAPQANVYFYPSNSKNVCTVEVGAEMIYQLPNVSFYLNPNIDVADNRGGFFVDYGLCKNGEINKHLSYDAKFLLGWGNVAFKNYYQPSTPVETNANPNLLKPQTFKSMRMQGSLNYQATNHFSIQPQLIVFRNFMTEYTYRHSLINLNGALTCVYAF